MSANGAGAAFLFGTGTFTVTAANGQATNGNWSAMPTGNTHIDWNTLKIQIGQTSDVYNISNYR